MQYMSVGQILLAPLCHGLQFQTEIFVGTTLQIGQKGKAQGQPSKALEDQKAARSKAMFVEHPNVRRRSKKSLRIKCVNNDEKEDDDDDDDDDDDG